MSVYLDVKGRGSSSDVADVESLKYDGVLNSLASRVFSILRLFVGIQNIL